MCSSVLDFTGVYVQVRVSFKLPHNKRFVPDSNVLSYACPNIVPHRPCHSAHVLRMRQPYLSGSIHADEDLMLRVSTIHYPPERPASLTGNNTDTGRHELEDTNYCSGNPRSACPKKSASEDFTFLFLLSVPSQHSLSYPTELGGPQHVLEKKNNPKPKTPHLFPSWKLNSIAGQSLQVFKIQSAQFNWIRKSSPTVYGAGLLNKTGDFLRDRTDTE
ncbi:hypothetical protein RRG08_035712 [Elysia crispata]|uniref:Uncharacterized protein n=1 Tax=Elysia crispata TaxID=231223 RepID=A0AAE0YJH7_9GAST|nr:hypothetical protein RRG08_035712 [Elysia crispata]